MDYDQDGLPDLHVCAESEDLLFRNLGSASFSRVELGLDSAPTSAGVSLATDSATVPSSGAPSAGASEAERGGKLARPEYPPAEIGRREVATALEPGGTENASPFPSCALALKDQDGTGCLQANSTPTLGMLYPLSSDLFVSSSTGRVGIGTTSPVTKLDVSGDLGVHNGSMLLYSGNAATILLDPDSNGDGFIGVLNLSPFGTRILLDGGADDNGGDITVRSASGGNTLFFDGETSEAGLVSVRASSGSPRVELVGDAGSGGGRIRLFGAPALQTVILDGAGVGGGGVGNPEIALYGSNGNPTVSIDNEDASGGGFLALWNSASRNAIQMFGDNGSDAGRIDLYNRNGGLVSNSILLNARDSVGTGSEIQLFTADGSNTLTIDLDGANGTTGQMQVNETDGSRAFGFIGNRLDLYNASGLSTINFDRISGTKSAVVDTPSYGQRLLYCMESPGVWFEDFGSAELVDGKAVIVLDPMFLETVTISEEHPMKVFVTPNGSTTGLYVEKGLDRFTVTEEIGGSGAIGFDWRVVAKRKGLESRRLDPYVDAREELGASADPELPRTVAVPNDVGGS